MAKKRVYWDACVWIGLLNAEPGKVAACRYVIDEAEYGRVDIVTSAFTLCEVFKKKCDGVQTALDAARDVDFEDFLQKDYVILTQVDRDIGTLARQLLRQHAVLKKPQDATHLASALLHNVDEFHTYDDVNILPLAGQLTMRNGGSLAILRPPDPPPPPVAPEPEPTLFS